MIEWWYLLAYAAVGSVTGVMAGLLGVGGGLVIVPTLVWLFALQGFDAAIIMHVAIGSSLASIVATSVSSSLAHHRRRAVRWPLVWQLSAGLLLGALSGSWMAKGMDSIWLQRSFGVFAIVVSAQMFFSVRMQPTRSLPALAGMNLVGYLIGLVSGLVGIAGGSMTVPFLTWRSVDMRQAVATSSACGVPIALAGAVGFILSGWSSKLLPAYSSGFVYWPAVMMIALMSVLSAPFGARLAHSLPVHQLKRVFAVLLVVIGIKLLNLF
ncbi:MAG: sulfite exporter TauE/SafE family protein [Chromatiales bacterium]|jgi:uncharacterized membrane protein YfcA